tara:strand:- start:471 stop:1013 length:543 start_codon:yes stop_codon:yes gene_type:complete
MASIEELLADIQAFSKEEVREDMVRDDLTRATSNFGYTAKKTAKADVEGELNKIASAYIEAMRGYKPESDTVAGNDIKSWMARLPQERRAELNAAIEAGESVGILKVLNDAYRAQADPRTSKLAEIQAQPDEVKGGVYAGIAQLVAGINGFAGSALRVAEAPDQALQALARRYATAEQFS